MSAHATPKTPGQYFLGVDGGGSKTLAIIVDAQGHERGRGLAGSSNYAAVGIDQAVAGLRDAMEQAAQAVGCQLPLQAGWFGLAGVDRAEDIHILRPHLRPLAAKITLTNDAELLLSALENTVGVALIAGTGSIALGRNAHGATTRAGGWGHILGDEGSGYELGRLALQAVARAADGRGAPTLLLERIMIHWHLEKPSDLIGVVYQDEDKARIARLSSIVFSAVQAGDTIARKIAQHAAQELALAALTVINALNFPEGSIPLALGGGIFIYESLFRTQVLHRIQRQRVIGPVVIVEEPALSAARALANAAPRK